MSLDSSLVKTLNSWGEHHRSLVRICSNDIVYAVILLTILWFLVVMIKGRSTKRGWRYFSVNLLVKGVLIFALPAGIAVLISETISAIYIRQRPFVAVPGVKLLVAHGADGGMPSHHVVLMTTLIAVVYLYQKKFAIFLTVLMVISGIARVAAGIHYPTDVLVAVVLGAGIAYLYRWGLLKFINEKWLALD